MLIHTTVRYPQPNEWNLTALCSDRFNCECGEFVAANELRWTKACSKCGAEFTSTAELEEILQ